LVVRAYCDGSGKTDGAASFYLTLAAYFATDASWAPLAREWVATLKDNGAPEGRAQIPYFHSKEAMNLRGAYRDWNRKNVERLTLKLMSVLGAMDRTDFFGVSCTVRLEDYRSVKREIPRLRPPENICLDFCITKVLQHPNRDCGIELLFDRGEAFHGVMDKLWRIRRPRPIWWRNKVTRIE